MIQANELRIGNLVNYLCEDNLDDRKEWYEPIVIDWQDLKNLSDRKKRNEWLTPCRAVKPDYAPLPLTEEMLLKCGFYHKGHGFYFFNITDWSNIQIKIYKSYVVVAISIQSHSIVVPVSNLHQLQNLYFALTGQELGVNL